MHKNPRLCNENRGFRICGEVMCLNKRAYRNRSIFLVFTIFPSTISV